MRDLTVGNKTKQGDKSYQEKTENLREKSGPRWATGDRRLHIQIHIALCFKIIANFAEEERLKSTPEKKSPIQNYIRKISDKIMSAVTGPSI